ncbi:MAG: tyrosine-type recombinase/integrase [Bacteroidia bacterium]|nr:tyrosine-type recombinase/integrase [Bacteroidia bacterium]
MRSVDLKNEIDFLTGKHKDKQVIWCKFPKNDIVLAALKKQYPFCRWSNTNKCWYITDSKEIRKQVGLALKEPSETILHKIHPINQPALQSMENQLKLKAYSTNTAKVYLGEFSQLLVMLKNHPVDTLTPDRLKSYMLYCVNELKLSEAHLHSRLNALKFYFEQVLLKDKFFIEIPRPKSKSKLPKVLSTKDIQKLFDVTSNSKHKLMLQLCYGMGLRVSEIVHLKISDIDSKRMQVLIENSKGKSDRYVNLPESVLTLLRSYYKTYQPKHFLFEGQYGGQYSIRSVQAVFKNGMRLAKINKPVGIHSLRHSYATHLLEYGTDMAFIQKLLGHSDMKTTMIYAQIGKKEVQNVRSPLDNM